MRVFLQVNASLSTPRMCCAGISRHERESMAAAAAACASIRSAEHDTLSEARGGLMGEGA